MINSGEEEKSMGITDKDNIFPDNKLSQDADLISRKINMNIKQNRVGINQKMSKRKNLNLYSSQNLNNNNSSNELNQNFNSIQESMPSLNMKKYVKLGSNNNNALSNTFKPKQNLNLFQSKRPLHEQQQQSSQDQQLIKNDPSKLQPLQQDSFQVNYDKFLQNKQLQQLQNEGNTDSYNQFQDSQQQQQQNINFNNSQNQKILKSDNSFLNNNNNSLNTNSNSQSYSMHMNLINANIQMKAVKQKSQNEGQNFNPTSFTGVNQFFKNITNNSSSSKFNNQKNIFKLDNNSQQLQEEDIEDADNTKNKWDNRMQIEDEQKEEMEKQDIQNKQLEFSIIESLTLYSNQSLEWFQQLFSQNIPQKHIGKYHQYFDMCNFKQKIQQALKYYRLDIPLMPNFSKDEILQEQSAQSNVIETFISVYQQFEQDKQKYFHVISKKPNMNVPNCQILFKWIKIQRNEGQQNNSGQQQDQYQFFFKKQQQNNLQQNQDFTYTPVAIISSFHKQYSEKLKNWGIKFINLKDTLQDHNDHEREHQNFKKYGQIHEKDIEVVLVKDKFVNNLWMRIMSDIFQRKISLEILSSFDFDNSQISYAQAYFCGETFSNNIRHHQSIFQQQQIYNTNTIHNNNNNQSSCGSRNQKTENQKNLSIFRNINQKKQQNILYTLKFFGNFPNYLLRQFIHNLQEAGIQINIQMQRYELSNYFSLDTMTHLLNSYE